MYKTVLLLLHFRCPFVQHILLLLNLLPSVFVSDCPPVPPLLNLGQITGVQLDYVTDSASHISVQQQFGLFP